MSAYFRRYGRTGRYLPYVIVYRLHHATLGLPDGDLQALCLAFAGHGGRSVADGAVRVHPDDPFPRFGIIVSGVHGLALVFERAEGLGSCGEKNTTKS
jgi:hypothetical protein